MRRYSLAVVLTALFATQAVAVAAHAGEPVPAGGEPVSAGYAQAMARDLGIAPDRVAGRLAIESRAALAEQKLRESLGDKGFGGAWFDEARGTLVVGITDAALASKVRAAGATPQVVKHSAARLDGLQRSLDRAARPAADAVSSWYVDPETNSVTVSVRPGAEAAARDFLAAAGVDPTATRFVLGEKASTSVDTFPIEGFGIYGGGKLSLTTTGGFCSSGLAVWRSTEPNFGMITAGHCGVAGNLAAFQVGNGPWTDGGTFRGSVFPGPGDYALVTHDNYQFEGTPFVLQQVLDYTGTSVPVDGLQEAPVRGSICRSGASSGWRCGRVSARNVTVNYPEGTTFGLTSTTAFATFGDSGGPFLSGTQAQGVLSGIGGGGAVSFFQPVRPVLQAFGLNLMTRFGPSLKTRPGSWAVTTLGVFEFQITQPSAKVLGPAGRCEMTQRVSSGQNHPAVRAICCQVSSSASAAWPYLARPSRRHTS
jgi:streptogrisin C